MAETEHQNQNLMTVGGWFGRRPSNPITRKGTFLQNHGYVCNIAFVWV